MEYLGIYWLLVLIGGAFAPRLTLVFMLVVINPVLGALILVAAIVFFILRAIRFIAWITSD